MIEARSGSEAPAGEHRHTMKATDEYGGLCPIERMFTLLEACIVAGAGNASAARHALARFTAWMNGFDDLDFAPGLGITADARAEYHRVQRNHMLRRAAVHVQAASQEERARLLLEALRSFETRLYPAWRSQPSAPSRASPIERDLFPILKLGYQIPRSTKQIKRILTEDAWTRGASFNVHENSPSSADAAGEEPYEDARRTEKMASEPT